MYKLTQNASVVIRLSDGASIGANVDNPDWVEYVNWLNAGNTPEPIVSIEDVRNNKLTEINDACGAEIISGFTSTALGASYSYDSDIEDQINLIGAVIAAGSGQSVEYKCYAPDGSKVWVEHTPLQMQEVYSAGLVFKLTQLKKASTLKNAVLAETDIDTILGINW